MSTAPAAETMLPPIREDLEITRGGTSYSGAPVWMLFDPIRSRFFRITHEMFLVLTLWNVSRTASALIHALDQRFGSRFSSDEIGTVVRMLDQNLLLDQPASGDWRSLHRRAQQRSSPFMRLIHNYLFFKVPLLRPERFIRATWPSVAFLFTRRFVAVAVMAGLTGAYLVSRQWEAFLGTFPFVFSLEGLVVSALAVVFIKGLHELGHAYMAHRYGCRVPTMGVAFMVMVPLLYTDVSEAWKLTSRRSRLSIDAAGIMVELCVAAFALLLWSFLPDGALRSAVFVLATAGWIMSLVVNLNPFMRFDGYYMLADLLGIENLQPRSFRHMRWRLREFLFRPGYPPPERFPPRLDAILTAYAVATAIYRLMLYLGIALLVYFFTIKLLGVLLFAVEIGFFILRPVWSEFREWWSMRTDILASRRTYVTAVLLCGAIVLAVLPLSTSVSAPAMLMPKQFARLYPQEAGRVERIAVVSGQAVKAGDPLFIIAVPAVTEQINITKVELDLAERRLARVGANATDLAARAILESRRGSLAARLRGLEERQAGSVIAAPFDGRVTELNPDIAVGQWVSRAEQLAFLSSSPGLVVRGYVKGDDTQRLTAGTTGWFIPDDVTLPKFPVSAVALSSSGAQEIDTPQLTSRHHGAIAVHAPVPGQRQKLVPVLSQYAVTAVVTQTPFSPERSLQGVVLLQGTGQSLAARLWQQVLKVVLREMSF
ncbi:biotin/lipoyl-binding protein [Pararhizobium sp.]|uniref:biotin/lipoyl-binding protein n=1 Tax=Pararhizobium sp. TaxID=1977563 RepID=UPI002720C9C7|nr:HlyD family efflux transporter periplasmic adaptor subunit [Pararhizobium sp.]MDO9417175.1 biotin/lipoyl-binding protein [Pararhizobium sp.]